MSTTPKKCTVRGCDGAEQARGYCTTHYGRWRRHGDPEGGGRRPGKGEGKPKPAVDPVRSARMKSAWVKRKARPKATGPDEFAGLGLSDRDTKKGALQRYCLTCMREHVENGELPTSCRFVGYELEGDGSISKNDGAPGSAFQAVSNALMVPRELGLVDWNHISDETRKLTQWNVAETVEDYVRDRIKYATINPWVESDWGDTPPLILCESRSLAGVLRGTAMKYTCPLAATNGQVGGFLHTDIGPLLEDERPVLHLGDLDLVGGHIEQNTRSVLEDIVGWLDWTRIAITKEQASERRLEPIIKRDNRYKDGEIHKAWETEALGQTTVIALVDEALDTLLPHPLTTTREREEEQREEMEVLLNRE